MTPLPDAPPIWTPTTVGMTFFVTSWTFFWRSLISARLAGTLVSGALSEAGTRPENSRRADATHPNSILRLVIGLLRNADSRMLATGASIHTIPRLGRSVTGEKATF